MKTFHSIVQHVLNTPTACSFWKGLHPHLSPKHEWKNLWADRVESGLEAHAHNKRYPEHPPLDIYI